MRLHRSKDLQWRPTSPFQLRTVMHFVCSSSGVLVLLLTLQKALPYHLKRS
jgi:hypothetical protein